MGDNKGKNNSKSPGKKSNIPTKQDSKSSPKKRNSTPIKSDKATAKNKKTPTKESIVDKKTPTPVKASNPENKTTNKSPEKKFFIKNLTDKKNPSKESNVQSKTSVKNLSPETKKTSSPDKYVDTFVNKRGKREGLPLTRVRTIMKTARYAEAISPDAVQLTAIAAVSFFLSFLLQFGVTYVLLSPLQHYS